jgi:hypothetical protein
MKITVEINGQPLESAVSAVTSVPSVTSVAVEDGGAGPVASSSTATQSDAVEDAGAPPLWLVEAVNRAMAKEGDSPHFNGVMEDGGSGPS